MRWEDGRRSDNVEDRRGQGGSGGGGKKLAVGGVGGLVLVVLALALGVDPAVVLQQTQGASSSQPQRPKDPAKATKEDKEADFVSVVLADTEDTWSKLFEAEGKRYAKPKLVLFEGQVSSACGHASAAMGPFYCPADQKAYLDLQFFDELHTRFGAPGDFAQAYVIAHEIGHHVQTLMGISQRVHQQKRGLPEAEANELSVKQELQADCFSGVWAYHANKERALLQEGDVEEGLKAATAIGDDTLQKRAQGYVVPESFTHGSSAQRVRWFKEGLKHGSIERCDTFKAASL